MSKPVYTVYVPATLATLKKYIHTIDFDKYGCGDMVPEKHRGVATLTEFCDDLVCGECVYKMQKRHLDKGHEVVLKFAREQE